MQRLGAPLLCSLAAGWGQHLVHAQSQAVPPAGTCGIGEDHVRSFRRSLLGAPSSVATANPPPPTAQHVDGWGNVNIACPPGETVAEVLFASWGDWTAECDGGIKCEASKEDCHGAGCNGGTTCACPCKGFVSTDVCSSCSWSKGACSGSSAQDFVEQACLGKAACGPFPANNGNEYDGKGKGDPCPGKSKHLGIAVRCCPADGCPILSEWGPQFLMFAFLAAGAYLGGGGAYRFHKLGVRGPDILPHQSFWKELRGLVEDGVAFARTGGKRRASSGSGRAGAYAVLPDATRGDKKSGGRRSAGKGSDSKGAEGKEKRKKRESKNSAEKKSDKADRAERTTKSSSGFIPAPAPGPSPAATGGSASASTASGGGGRWVHVPN